MTISCFSQTGYPKKIVLNADTVIAVSEDQLTKINVGLLERSLYKEQLDSTKARFAVVEETVRANRQYINSSYKLIVLLNEQIQTQGKKLENSEASILKLNDELKYQKNKTVKMVIFSSGVTLSLASIFYFVAK